MKFKSPSQLKQCLANCGVTHGYQLWYMQNDTYKLLVKCGRDVSAGKCAGKRVGGSSNKGKGKLGEERSEPSKVSQATKERWRKKKLKEKENLKNAVECPFRLCASWTSTEKCFQIKTLYPDHKCCRNYNLGSLVTFRLKAGWIEGCRKVISLDGCFLTHTCNDMVLSLLYDDLNLNEGAGLTIISDGHKGLSKAVKIWLSDAEHRQYTRHIYANFKKNGVKNLDLPKPLPLGERKLPGRPRKRRIRHPSEYDHKISRVGRVMHCHRYWESGHNKSKCTNAPKPKPDNFYEIHADKEIQNGSNVEIERDQYQQVGPSVDEIPKYIEDPVMPTSNSGNKRKEPLVKKKSSQVNEACGSKSNLTPEAASSAPFDQFLETPQDPKKKANKRKKKADSEHPLHFRIYHKNRGRSERIAKLQAKKFKFDANGI
nr:hypothetical protein [Tanacetum cinerariifolium]